LELTPLANEKKVVSETPKTLFELASSADKSEFEYVSIPTKDTRGFSYPDIRLNHLQFKAGEKHFVHPAIAAEIRDRMRAYDESVLRSLLPNQDRSALSRFLANIG
jgi:hypothetical protein